MTNIEAPIQAVDMQPFEFEVSPQAQADLATMNGQQSVAELAPIAQEDEVQMVVGFNPDLVALYVRAEPGSEFAKQLEMAMMADLVVNNAVAYGLIGSEATEDYARQAREEEKKEEVLV
jgi:hypothetical protein